ncbi:MAG: threonine synthase [Ruminococcaceae bacterium]|nr:threonine synthase [Oscillospiraceae bacterium]
MKNINYISTRGNNVPVSSAQAIKQGLANDGGLFMPEVIPSLTEKDFEILKKASYPERAAYVMSKFLTDYTYEELLADCNESYSEARFPGGAAPITNVGNLRLLELWHGPTCAFKDMALQVMPRLLSRALVKTGEKRTAFILVATSGDTGKAALEGYKDVDGIKIMVFYPVDGVSKVQKLQMATQEGNNVTVCAIKGNFDDAQNGVKKIFGNAETAEILDKNNHFFSSANSINWGRLVPQIVYYISSYCDMVNAGDIKEGDEVNICVPTGNFGNIFAAYIAKMMGLPVNRFICASNCNNILTDFISTGTYDRNRAFHTTMSPSMDILISSNLERLLYVIAGQEKTASYMKELNTKGVYTVEDEVKEKIAANFSGYFCGEEDTAKTIKETFDKYNYLIDTHTAVAVKCAEEYMKNTGDERKIIVASTASPYKFASNVYASLTGEILENEFDSLKSTEKLSGTKIPTPLATLESKQVRFTKVIEPDDMTSEVLKTIGI